MLAGRAAHGRVTEDQLEYQSERWCGRGDSFMLAGRAAHGRVTEDQLEYQSERWCGRGDSNPHGLAATSS
jgi:hypothetical protein